MPNSEDAALTNTLPAGPVTVAAISAWSPLEAEITSGTSPTRRAISVLTASGRAAQSVRIDQLALSDSRVRRAAGLRLAVPELRVDVVAGRLQSLAGVLDRGAVRHALGQDRHVVHELSHDLLAGCGV